MRLACFCRGRRVRTQLKSAWGLKRKLKCVGFAGASSSAAPRWLAVTVVVSGWLHDEDDFCSPWLPLSTSKHHGERSLGGSHTLALCWERKNLLALGHALHSFIRTNVIKQAIQQGIMQVRVC
jgi:hypothetical protein